MRNNRYKGGTTPNNAKLVRTSAKPGNTRYKRRNYTK